MYPKMGYIQRVLSMRFARFVVVGAGNTAINFAVLNTMFYGLQQNKIASSIIATSCAIVFSFLMNRSYVFRDTSRPINKFLLFASVSALGVLVIQTSVYSLCVLLLRHSADFVAINESNLAASLSVTLWNYNGYRLFVFNGNKAARLEDDGISEADQAA